jgi:DNA topoisomerase-2
MNEQRLKKFIDDDLRVFSNLDNVRSIPSVVDGFKDSHRKSVYGLIKHGKDKIKVAQLASATALLTAYNHGEGALASTIIGLAQKFPGSNNVNLFEPIGQFGSILSDEAANPRYIYTKPSEHLRQYIRAEDDAILKYREEEGQQLDPEYFLPVVPMWIVNGVMGIGTGHSSKILSRSPANVIAAVKVIIDCISNNTPVIPDLSKYMTPHFNGWKGKITKGDSNTQWIMTGCIEKVSTTVLKITELPVQYSVDKYKEILITLMDEGVVKDFDNNSNEDSFEFVVTVPREVGRLTEAQLISKFKLSLKFGENVTLWDANNKLKRYNDVTEALIEFVNFRLDQYQPRKDYQVAALETDLTKISDKLTFINWWNSTKNPHLMTADEIKAAVVLVDNNNFDSLLSMQIRSLTVEKVKLLEAEHKELSSKLIKTKNQTLRGMFLEDISQL